jgi:D-inositol-3-phosphate glycosyltransferase
MLDIAMWNPRAGLDTAGGTETFVRNMAQELHHRPDTQVTLYTGADEAELGHVPVEVVPVWLKEGICNRVFRTLTPGLAPEIESLSGTVRLPDLTDHDLVTTHYYLDAVLLSRLTDVPVVFRLPGIKQANWRWWLTFQSDVAAYVSNSPTTTTRVQNWYDRDLYGPVFAGVDTDQFKPDPGQTDPFRALYVGRLGEGKGLFRLLNAATLLDGTYQVHLVGDGPLRDDLEDYAGPNVTFHGTVPHDQIHTQYQQAGMLVLPTEHEAFPVCVIEALATGTPVITTDIDATRLTITSGKNGLLLPDRRATTIKQAIQTVTDYDRPVQEAVETADQYRWEHQASRFRCICERVYRDSKQRQ